MVTRDTTTMQMGPGKLTADGTDLGYTRGETTIEITTEFEDGHPDQLTAPGEKFTKNIDIKISGEFVQANDIATLLNYIMPDSVLAGDKVSNGRTPGYRASQNTFQLVVHPEEQAVTTKDLTVYKALGSGTASLAYAREGLRVIPFEFVGLDDGTRTNGDRLFSFGNSADAAAPTRTSTTPADAATGVAVATSPVIIFSEAMSARTLSTDNSISPCCILYDETSDAYVACASSISTTTNTNDTLTMNPDSNFGSSKVINVLVSEVAQDVAGNAHAGTTTEFTTA